MTATRSRTAQPTLPRLTFGGLLNSEWIKLRSVRSSYWTYGIIILVAVGISALMAGTMPIASRSNPEGMPAISVINLAVLVGFMFAQLVAAVLGALVITGEYSTGMIRTTLTAAPKRLPAYLAKIVVLAVCTAIVSIVSSVLAYLVAILILQGRGAQIPALEGDFVGYVAGGILYVVVVALFALGLGTLLRSGAGAIAAVIGVLLVAPTILSLLPLKWLNDLGQYLPSNLGQAIMGMGTNDASIDTGLSVLYLVLWPIVALALGAWALLQRDA